jgi:hypothetical protein
MPRRNIFEESYIKKRVTGHKKRNTDQALLEKLRSLVRENGNACWVQGEYRFLFPDGVYRIEDDAGKGSGNGSFGSYFWRSREIYVTYAEALHLYERLVLEKSGRRCATNGLLRNLRRRFGDTFLAEYLPVMEQMKRKNRGRKEVEGGG